MTAVLDVMISDHATATVAGERVVRGRHRTINDAAMDRCKEIARARRERVAVRAKAAERPGALGVGIFGREGFPDG